MRIEEENNQQKVDITDLYFQFKTKWRNVFIYRLGEQDFIYRALGRKEYKDICTDTRFNDIEKEDIICDQCLLYPQDFDFENCDAGIPTELVKNILKNSYLDSVSSRTQVLDYYRADMYDLDNQITAVISEAFPNLDIEEIEQWDVEKTMKYMSRAEWVLHNLRGVPFASQPQGDFYNAQEGVQPQNNKQQSQQQQKAKTNINVDSEKTIRGGERKNKLTPEKIAELAELKRKFPEIDWDNDMGYQGIAGLEQEAVDTTPPALRVAGS
ncbi:hypothetical protein ACTQX2_00230 [Megamonas funiformis]|uniref:hypothetical protein n=1 Tax=Megamonas funiformis TaxID=437897 RepID=UPI003F98619B